MRLLRFRVDNQVFEGILEGEEILPAAGQQFPRRFQLNQVKLLPPCVPSKIVAVGLNYRDHAEELHLTLPEEPLLFMKPSTSVIGPGDSVSLPPQSQRVDYEAELGIVIAKTARRVGLDEARDYILGYTCLNDVTARDLQTKDGQWTRAKGFDTFCPIGPWIDTEIDPTDLGIELYLNGERKQRSRTSNLIFSPAELVAFISGVMTLQPGDVIATGTPSGIGPMKHGDNVEVRIEGIGSLVNPIVKNDG
ncbi:fumarylacetoacetate hydrolase family protein [Desulfomonile tiedjei]|uniref:2-keto-4-pentenoate hydratase/2-oxohepta-3-ene-1,7-dioic acid hydratase n=1 Tax=Desulfomonile tiedjei (strain ATCC 49306 / DSM 6799 / DCB-1) TaxID=706587 RepID=I4C846_DESTA|nr:fumarylacetoacetate hydrolase family protein [Desulfomonile tiedjei]AFM25737.1 2-keto-4-pentenoate hydratase/2-oxohepta-3-ene-1,7-dioic acid hydratase [Desulfomonile tiedjei DSM 6799]